MKLKLTEWMVVVAVGFLAAPLDAQQKPALTTPADQVSYGIGVDLARNFKRQGLEFDVDILIQGLKDGMTGEKLLISEKELRQILIKVQTELRQKQAQLRGRTPAEINLRKGQAYLAGNATKAGVTTVPSGLQYLVLKAGVGRKPTDADTVECIYRGMLLDGTEFISSEVGKPATFKVNEAMIPAWTEALKLMPVGSKWRLFIPPQLAYGTEGVGRDVGPNETILAELELLGIK